MQYDRTLDPALCVSKEASRYTTNGVGVIDHKGTVYLAATDGRMASLILPTTVDSDEVGTVHQADAFRHARKQSKGQAPVVLRLNGKAVATDGTEFQALETDRFPDVSTVIPKEAPIAKIILDPARLLKLAKAIGCKDGVTIEIHDWDGKDGNPVTPYVIRSMSGDRASFGILMPITADK